MKKLIALLFTVVFGAVAQVLPPNNPPQLPSDPVFSYSASNVVPHDGGAYYADNYQWTHRNTGQQLTIYNNGGVAQPQFAEPAGNYSAHIFNAWAFKRSANNIKVALIDTGFDLAHPDLAGRFLPGVKVEGGAVIPGSTVGSHGTQGAAIIGAIGNNSVGIAGICRDGVNMLPISLSGRTFADYIAALDYAVNQGSKVIYFPHGWTTEPPGLKDAFIRARNAGVIVVCAAVQGLPTPAHDYPAEWVFELDNMILVGGHDMAGQHWPESGWQHNGYIHFLAPGRRVPTLWPGTTDVRYTSGTSIASAFGVGAVALLWDKNPTLSHVEIKNLLVSTSTDGCLNLGAALAWLPPTEIVWAIPAGLHRIEITEDFLTWVQVADVTGPLNYTLSVPRTGKSFWRYTLIP